MMKKILFIILAVMCCSNLVFAQMADKDLGQDKFFLSPQDLNKIDPKKIIVELKPGETSTEEFIVANASPYQRTFKLYVTDYYLNDQGNSDYKNENEERKLSKWITLDTQEVTLEPKQVKPVKVTFAPPADIALDDYQGGIAGVYTFPSKTNPNLKIALRYIMGVDAKISNDPQPVPKFSDDLKTNVLGAQIYLPLSVAIFIGCMAYFFIEKRKEKSLKKHLEEDRQK